MRSRSPLLKNLLNLFVWPSPGRGESMPGTGRLLLAAALMLTPVHSMADIVVTPERLERGEYLVTLSTCDGCHAPDLSGGMEFAVPGYGIFRPANLTPHETDLSAIYAYLRTATPVEKTITNFEPLPGELAPLNFSDAPAMR